MLNIQIEEIKLSLFAGDMILCIEDPNNAIRKLVELISESGKVVGYKINTQKETTHSKMGRNLN